MPVRKLRRTVGVKDLACNKTQSFGNKNHEARSASKGSPMIEPAIPFISRAGQYILRVARHESTKRGLAAAGAGVIMSLIIEAWPASRAG
jgi:hypothetical protein